MDKIREQIARCPNCSLEWPAGCEQTACIDRYGQCITCHFRDNMPENRTHEQAQVELAEIASEAKNVLAALEADDE